MKFIDLFCGCGGFTEGMKQAGHTPVLGVDLEEIALESYEENHHCEVWNKDVLNISFDDLPKADFLIGSPPCQQYSKINKNIMTKKIVKPDTKCLLKFLEIGKYYDFYVGENVTGIIKHLNGINYQILAANGFELFHERQRCFFGIFPKVRKVTKNPTYFPTPVGPTGGRNRYVQDTLRKRKSKDKCLSYPPMVAKWIMGFPDDYVVLGSMVEQKKQIGNAVCPPVSKAIGEAIKNVS